MRPVRVTMVGFGIFADEVTVDFDGVDVFALVGPTGSGKSTIIDAICFALYGSVPRHDDRRAVAGAVHVLATEAKVALEFLFVAELGKVLGVAERGRVQGGIVRRYCLGGSRFYGHGYLRCLSGKGRLSKRWLALETRATAVCGRGRTRPRLARRAGF